MAEQMSLEDEHGWPYDEDDDPPHVTESDVDFASELAAADIEAEEYWEAWRADRRCLPGCPHFGRCDNYR